MRFGVIGTNWITEEFIQAGHTVEGFSLQAVCSRTLERAKEFAAKFAAPFFYTNPAEMAASGQIDAVYIASPNCFHAEQAILCMSLGLHVLCEKPLASNADEVEAMLAAAKKHDVLLMEAVKSTLVPNFFLRFRTICPSWGKFAASSPAIASIPPATMRIARARCCGLLTRLTPTEP